MPGKTNISRQSEKTATIASSPKYIEMIADAILSKGDPSGCSRQTIVKYIQANYKVEDGFENHVKFDLKRGLTNGLLTQAKGGGSSGIFNIAKKESPADFKPTTPTKKTVAKPNPILKAMDTAKPTTNRGPAMPKTRTPSKKAAKPKSYPAAKKVAPAKKVSWSMDTPLSVRKPRPPPFPKRRKSKRPNH